MQISNYPYKKEGLYDPAYEHDACGIGFITHIKGKASHFIIEKGIELLENLDHRGATGAEKNSGDGAGLLMQVPHDFLTAICSKEGIVLPADKKYGVGQLFLPVDDLAKKEIKTIFTQCVEECGQRVLGWRKVPVDNTTVGESSLATEPSIEQVFIEKNEKIEDISAFERKLYVIRKHAQKKIWESDIPGADYFYVCSLSYKTLSYKGMLTTGQLRRYFKDFSDERLTSAFAIVHSRFSTNTFPAWPLAQPFRYLCHNGEINTLRGNINWMKSREVLLNSDLFDEDDLTKIKPIIMEGQSDSACLDDVVELLTLAGRSVAQVMMMLIPEAWAKDEEMDPYKKGFYEYHATMMEPWDGPASVAFTDGRVIGATLDRNGLRPSRWCVTEDDFLVLSSEAGAIHFEPEKVLQKGRLQPGKMLLVDLQAGKIISDEDLKKEISAQQPYLEWVANEKIELESLEKPREINQPPHKSLRQKQLQFGYSLEDLRVIILPMAENGAEPIGSMGSDTPLSVLSDKSQNLFNYFYQLFAQVTNPPIDPIRETSVMSLVSFVGQTGNILEESPTHCRLIELPIPILRNDDLERLRWVDKSGFQAKTIPIVFKVEKGKSHLEEAIKRVQQQASLAIDDGYSIIVLSDRSADSGHAPIPSLLMVSAVHHHLIREGKRAKCGLVIETGEAREVHHFALLLGYGASAVNPYLAFDTVIDMVSRDFFNKDINRQIAIDNYIKAIEKGLLKIFSKVGISTVQSYIGAQIFEAIGLNEALIDKYFPGTSSRIGGIDIKVVEKESLLRHDFAYPSKDFEAVELDPGGQYSWRYRGEHHLHSPAVIHKLQNSTRKNDYQEYKEFASLINKQDEKHLTLRSLLEFANNDSIPIEEVEPAEQIYKRFATGAMSYGSISWEAHTTLAIAMNRIGAKSNTGEGGEDSIRFKTMENGDSLRSAIKQVASGRFGVTSNYLVNGDELQIKIAQGAKPGEGGQLPGHKVNSVIAKTRYSTPGVGLISPPPHHDIYSIEDLAQLIYDLKNSNDKARISVKLVSEVGVGTIAAGVTKAHADVVLISGYEGGTGASPLSSIKHAGIPWELGLAETHQTLIRNRLRDRVVLQTDGMIRTGRDLAVAAMLGAEEWGVATGALIVSGCIMMRKCHLNSCPVGIATQREDLRKLFTGDPGHVVNYFKFMTEELREIMADLGFRTVDEMIGRVDKLKQRTDIDHWKASSVDLRHLLHLAKPSKGDHSYCCVAQDHGLDKKVNYELIRQAEQSLENKKPIKINLKLKNINRTVGTLLSAEISKKYGEEGLRDNTIYINAIGSAGQSFAAFGAKGITFDLEGEANDYFGKGLTGSKLILRPFKESKFHAHDNVIVGNVAFYGATGGEAYIRGLAGERFCVRNSGVEVVVDSVGDHGCEYMTGGRVIILGEIGKNFAAGMSGGIAYVWDEKGVAKSRINQAMVGLEKIETDEEKIWLLNKIEKHVQYTSSIHSRSIVENWKKEFPKFIKIMPEDYKRSMKQLTGNK